MVKCKISQQLRNLWLVEACYNKFKTVGPASYFIDRHQIDGVWFTRNTVIKSVAMYSFHFEVGDHRAYMVDFQVNSTLGELATRLNSPNKILSTWSFPIIFQWRSEIEESKFNLRKTDFKIKQLKEQWHTLDLLLREIRLHRIDELGNGSLINVEKKCKKFRTREVV